MNKKILCVILVFGLILSGCGGNNTTDTNNTKEYVKWSAKGKVASILPVPKSNKVLDQSEDEDGLEVTIGQMSKKDFKNYTKSMKELGWDKDISDLDDMYTVDYGDKYHAYLSYDENNNEIYVSIDSYAAKQKEKDANKKKKLKWKSDYDIIKLVPTPKTKYGDVYIDNEDQLNANLYQVSLKDFKQYIKECKEMGWKSEESYDGMFKAKNKYECDLQVMFLKEDYNDVDRISIELDTSAATEDTENILKKLKNKVTEKIKTGGVDPKFKKAMDQYEKFFDEYIKFMKKYNKSSDPIALLDEYTKYLEEYTKYMDKLNSIDEKKLSAADSVYYLKVTNRINKKLLKAAL